MFRTTLIGAALLALTLTGAPALAAPSQTADQITTAADAAAVEVTVTVIHAKQVDGGVDAPLERLSRYLVRSFKQYRSFKKVSDKTSKLGVGSAASLKLPDGTELTYTYEGSDAKGFIKVHISVGGLKSTVRVRDGGTFFQAGRKFQDGMIILAFDARVAR